MRKIFYFAIVLLICISCNPESNKKQPTETPKPEIVIPDEILSEEPEKEMEEQVETKPEFFLEKELNYDNKYTLEDIYNYKDTIRLFQFDKIREKLEQVDSLYAERENEWGILQNRRGINGVPPLPKINKKNKYNQRTDEFGIEQEQAIPLYLENNLKTPKRYARDGSLIKIIGQKDQFIIAHIVDLQSEFYIPEKYIFHIEETPEFNRVIIVDRHNQNISSFERVDYIWKIRSMVPCTTGATHPPYQKETPLGLFVLQNKLTKMFFYVDGTTDIGGYAPWANRFSQGAYIHGIPVNLPQTEIIEYSKTLGTIPRSHACVRTVSSHAEYIFNNYPVNQTLVYVIE